MFRIFALIMLLPLNAFAWEVNPNYKDENGYVLLKRKSSLSELGAVIDKEKRTLKSLSLGRIMHLDSDEIQNDLLSFLQENYPKKIEAALSSAGNMHNPKVTAIRKEFGEAVLETEYMKSLNKVLKSRNYEIESVSLEKFFIIQENSKVLFDALVWLKIKQLTSSNGLVKLSLVLPKTAKQAPV